jgi:hypothetical protein
VVGPHEAGAAPTPVELGLPEKFNATVQLAPEGNTYGFAVAWAWMWDALTLLLSP